MRFFTGLGLLCLLAAEIFPQDLTVGPGDMRIEQRTDGGFHLYIRKKPEVSSVLLTESTKDPRGQADNFAYRAQEWNAVNGDEIRLIDGLPIPKERRLYSIIDSTPETHPELGPAFHLYLPYIMIYGSEDSRHGEVYVSDGVYINIRSFSLPYGDYRGSFRDNPYRLQITQRTPETPPVPEGYMRDTVESFADISSFGRGELIYSTGPDDLVDRIQEVLEQERGKSLDLVLCLDTTSSMKNDIDAVRERLIPMLQGIIGDFPTFRIGMILYKDYLDEYLNRMVPFTSNFDEFQQTLNAITISGGRDVPEAVYEALYEGARKFPWEAPSRLIILIGDAPPHPRPRGEITREMVNTEVNSRRIKVTAIILPQ
ncbi:MAG: VWA domain-containing protein [Treponema sp.]|nr:VWA domain-containing protein [Treponema sp.]